MGHDISEEVADSLAKGNVPIESSASLENLLEGPFPQEIAPDSL